VVVIFITSSLGIIGPPALSIQGQPTCILTLAHRRHLVPTLEWHCPHLSLISHQICISPTRTWHVWYRTRSLIYPIFYWFEVGGHSLMRITENLHNIPKRRSKFTVDHSNAISIKSMPTDWSQRNCQRGETCDYLRVSFSSVW